MVNVQFSVFICSTHLNLLWRLFQSMLAAYAVLVPTLYGNRETRLYEFHCLNYLNFFLCNVAWSLWDNIAQDQDCISRNIFLMQSCLEPLGQHCIRFLPVQCCSKSIKTTLHWICSYTKLSGASWTTLHRIFSCAMLSQEY